MALPLSHRAGSLEAGAVAAAAVAAATKNL